MSAVKIYKDGKFIPFNLSNDVSDLAKDIVTNTTY